MKFKTLIMAYFPPVLITIPILILLFMIIMGWRLRKSADRSKGFLVKISLVAIVAVLSVAAISVNLVDLFQAKKHIEQIAAYQETQFAIRNTVNFIESYYHQNKQYPADEDDLKAKIPYISRPNITLRYRLVFENVYEITARHEKWNDIEFMFRKDSAKLYMRRTTEPKAEFKQVNDQNESFLPVSQTSSNIVSYLWHRMTGKAKKLTADVAVVDSDTKKPIRGAHVILAYHKEMGDSEPGRIGEDRECKGNVDGVTDKDGKIGLVLDVDNCPTRGIKSEMLSLLIKNQGYATYHREIRREKIDVALERLGYSAANPPIRIEYPEYVVDVEKYMANLDLINEMNSREIGAKTPIKSYFAWEYSHRESFGDAGFDQFLEKLECTASVKSVPLLKDVLAKKYLLPYKSFKMSDDPSWRAGEYVYEMGRNHVAKALLNVSDIRTDDLLPLSTDIPSQYVQVLEECNIKLTSDDYWAYLSGKYVSRAQNRMLGDRLRPDPLLLVKSKMKERLKGTQYMNGLFKLYQTATANGTDKELNEHYRWQIDQKRLAEDLFEYNVPGFTAEVKRILPTMEANAMTRKYLAYLYKRHEYAYLARALKRNKSLMKAFLGEDVKGQSSWNTATNEHKDLEIEECLLPKMPKVTKEIRKKIETYLKDESDNYTFYRWYIRNLSLVNRRIADKALQDIYEKASVEPYKEQSKYEKRYALQGGSEGKLKGLCAIVYSDLQIKQEMKRDYFSVAKERLHYLKSSCPSEFSRLVSTFKATNLREPIAQRKYEASYGYDNRDYKDSIWEGINEYFPKDKAKKIIDGYFCGSEGPGDLNIRCGKDTPKTQPVKKALEERVYPDRTYQILSGIVITDEDSAHNHSLADDRFHAFFAGEDADSRTSKRNASNWSTKLEFDKALPILQAALSSGDPNMVRAGFTLSLFTRRRCLPTVQAY